MRFEQLAGLLGADAGAIALGPSIAEYRSRLVAAGAPPERLLDLPAHPSALDVARLAQWPESFDARAVMGLEPHYVRGSGAEHNPQFPPLPGPEPAARIREDGRD